MKRGIVNVLCTTAVTLLVLAVFGAMFGARFLFISSVFQSLLVNLVIHAGLIVTKKFESSYAVLEYMLDIGYTVAVVLTAGAAFHWYASTPAWVLAAISVIVYCAGLWIGTLRTRREIKEINELLHRQSLKPTGKETPE